MKKNYTLFLFFFFISLPSFGSAEVVIPVLEIGDLNPLRGNSIFRNKILNQVLEGLVRLDETMSPVPSLATKWEIDSKNRKITFWLNSNKKFHDLSELSARSVYDVFLKAKKHKNDLVSQISEFQKCQLGKSCPSFVIHSNKSFSIHLKNSNYLLFLKKLASINGSIYKKSKKGLFLGTGPYRILSLNKSKVKMRKMNSDKLMTFKVVTHEHALNLFLKKKLSIFDTHISNLATEDLKKYPYKKKIAGTYSLLLNTAHGVLRDKKVRRAIYQLIDVDKITPLLGRNFLPASSLIPRGFLGHRSIKRKSNEELAKAIVGKTTKGKTLKISLSKKSRNNLALVKYLKTTFSKIGITLKVSYESFRERIDGFRSGKYDMMIRGDAPTYYDSGKMFISFVSWEFENMSAFKNDELDALFKLYEKQVTASDSIKTLYLMEDIIKDEAPLVPLSYPIFYEFYQKDINVKNSKQISTKFWDYPYHRLF